MEMHLISSLCNITGKLLKFSFTVGCKKQSIYSFTLFGHTPTHTCLWTHTFLHTMLPLLASHSVLSAERAFTHKHAHTYTQIPAYLKYFQRLIGAADTRLMQRCVCVKAINERRGGWGVEMERYRGKCAIQKGVARRLWRIILCRQGQRSERRQQWPALLVSSSSGLHLNALLTMNIIRKPWFPDLTGKTVSTRPPCCGNHGSFKSRLSGTYFWSETFSVYLIEPDWYWIFEGDCDIDIWELTCSYIGDGDTQVLW